MPDQTAVDRAASALCDAYLGELLIRPKGLPGVRFHELTEGGKDVYRRMVRVVATALEETPDAH